MDTSNRISLALSSAAFLVVAVTIGGPAVAAFVNADQVDGKDAVSAGATVQQRRGDLVATNATTGRLPNNIIVQAPDSARLGGKLASTYRDSVIPVSWLPAEFVLPTPQISGVADFTTSQNGHLVLQANVPGDLGCDTLVSVVRWLEVDDVAVRNSVTYSDDAPGAARSDLVTMLGVTPFVVPAGAHTLAFRASCNTGTAISSAQSPIQSAIITVLGGGYAGP